MILGLTILLASIAVFFFWQTPPMATAWTGSLLNWWTGSNAGEESKTEDAQDTNVLRDQKDDGAAKGRTETGKQEDDHTPAPPPPSIQQTRTSNGRNGNTTDTRRIEGDAGARSKEQADRKAMPPPSFSISQPSDGTSEQATLDKSLSDCQAMPPPPSPPKPPTSAKSLQDRAAMPPPPPPSSRKTRSPQTTPKARPTPTTSSVPPLVLSPLSSPSSSSPPPSFPAANSAQRASGGTTRTGPPRLAPLTSERQPPLHTLNPSSSLAPPVRGPAPNRLPPGGSNTVPLTTSTLTTSTLSSSTKKSKKIVLSPGHSPLDWAALCASPSSNLRGRNLPPQLIPVPPSVLKMQNGRSKDENGVRRDAWTALGGRVYNIEPYRKFHPAGEGELMRCAGKDGTKLFNEVHPWVNWEGMLGACLVGVAVSEKEVERGGELDEMD